MGRSIRESLKVEEDLRQIAKIKKYVFEVAEVASELATYEVAEAVDVLEEARQTGHKVIIFGNGGSAATSLHFASDLAKGAIRSGKPRMKVFTLTDNIALLTAWANDNMYRNSFAEQIENLAESGDVVIAISGSGSSWNVLRAVEVARAKGAKCIGLTGKDGGKLKGLVDISIHVPSHDMEKVEDVHLIITHAITHCLRGEKSKECE